MNSSAKTIIWICIFSVAMAALEAAVVVYLRALYYPGEFTVSFKLIDADILLVEVVREAATLVMLFAIGLIAGKNLRERFAYFLLSFAVWDIFYYAWLKIFIGWPPTLLAWDILFLIPFTWIGPVAAPLLCSLTMLFMSFVILRSNVSIPKTVWGLQVLGAALILFTFTRDYAELIIANGFLKDYPDIMQNQLFMEKAAVLVPKPYQWNIFWLGELMFAISIAILFINSRPKTQVLWGR